MEEVHAFNTSHDRRRGGEDAALDQQKNGSLDVTITGYGEVLALFHKYFADWINGHCKIVHISQHTHVHGEVTVSAHGSSNRAVYIW